MSDKKSFGSCRAKYTRRDEDRQYVEISANEAARLIVALQNVVGEVISTERRQGESDITLWLHAPKDESVTITVYRKGG
ncbi:MAG: hypothetical protein GY922_09245 [Proteobacteria bacterium]|nr:hypothetical protein [Pseudomonadota bacterium]